jgi:hypothetical protein
LFSALQPELAIIADPLSVYAFLKTISAERRLMAANGLGLGFFPQFLGVLRHFQTGKQFHVTWRATDADKTGATDSIFSAVLAPVMLELIVGILLIAPACWCITSRQSPHRSDWPTGSLDVELWN